MEDIKLISDKIFLVVLAGANYCDASNERLRTQSLLKGRSENNFSFLNDKNEGKGKRYFWEEPQGAFQKFLFMAHRHIIFSFISKRPL